MVELNNTIQNVTATATDQGATIAALQGNPICYYKISHEKKAWKGPPPDTKQTFRCYLLRFSSQHHSLRGIEREPSSKLVDDKDLSRAVLA